MEQTMPFVTAMIVVRNEEKNISKAILSLLNQDYPKNKYDLLIIDGESTDQTIEIAKRTVEEYSQEHYCVPVRYYNNSKRVLAAGWNIGIKEAKGEFVVRIDAHAQADSCLVSKAVQILLRKEDVVCVGGRIETEPLSEKGKIISDVLSSPFGVGNARFRYADESGYVDTVAYGVYRKDIFEKAGYFNEEFARNQDNDMHGRIKRCGGKFYLDASIRSVYHSRETVKDMMKQAFGNGKWIIIGCKISESKKGISVRHLIPLFFVVSNLLLATFGFFLDWVRWIALAMYILYFALGVFFALKKTRCISSILKMCACYWLLHISYGCGSLKEIILFRK